MNRNSKTNYRSTESKAARTAFLAPTVSEASINSTFKRLGLITALLCLLVVSAAGIGEVRYLGKHIESSDGINVQQFTGIRYARPPTAKRRWRPPQPVEVSGDITAAELPPICIQGNGNVTWYRRVADAFRAGPDAIGRTPTASEDCLYLNVWTADPTAQAPVMVWIHGGSNLNGWSFEPNYLGEELAARGVVVVSIQYRLGVFGFLAHPQLTAESPHDTSGNYALLDQLEALRWVKQHIARFGGNADNVTIFGESAGAGDIAYLLASPLSDGLFHKAISQSGGWPINQQRTLQDNERQGEAFLWSAEVENIEQLRQFPAEQLLKIAGEHYDRDYDDPAIDGYLLPDSPRQLLSDQSHSRPLLIGSNTDELRMYIQQPSEASWQHSLANLPRAAAIEAHLHDLPVLDRMNKLQTAQQFFCPSIALASAVRDAGAPVFVYQFARSRNTDHDLGAYHGAEIPYIFNRHDDWLPTDQIDRDLTILMMNFWVNFAHNGDPNHAGSPPWPQWSATQQAMRFSSRSQATTLDTSLCQLLQPI